MSIRGIGLPIHISHSFSPFMAAHKGIGGFGRRTTVLSASHNSLGGLPAASTQFSLKGIPSTPGIAIGHALVINIPDKFSDFPRIDLLEEAKSTGTPVAQLIERRIVAFSTAFDRVVERIKTKRNTVAASRSDKAEEKLRQELDTAFTMILMDTKRLCLERMQNPTNPISAVEALEGQYKLIAPLRNDPQKHFRRIPDDCFDVFLSVLREKHGKSIDLEEMVNTCPFDDVVIVANAIPYDSASILFHEKVRGAIREKGSPGDHVSIMTDSASKAGLVRITGATGSIPNGAQVVIDGDTGNVVVNPDKKSLHYFTGKIERNAAIYKKLERSRHKRSPISVNSNCDNPMETERAISSGSHGIGLVRTERFFGTNPYTHQARAAAPEVREQIEFYNAIIVEAKRRPVKFRTIDLISDPDPEDKLFSYINGMGGVPNGTSGIGLCLDPSMPLHGIFKSQLEAFWLSKARQVMFPMIRNGEDYYRAMEIAVCVRKMLHGHVTNPYLNFGVMIEHPDLFKDLAELARKNKHIFFSIGSNDLSSFITLNDRYSGSSAEQFNVCHFDPRVFAAIRDAIDIVESEDREISLCGKLVNDWRGVIPLHGLGLKQMSFSNAQSSDVARFITQNTKRKQIKPLIESIWNIRSPEAVIQAVESFTRDQIRSGVWKELKLVYPLLFDEICQ